MDLKQLTLVELQAEINHRMNGRNGEIDCNLDDLLRERHLRQIQGMLNGMLDKYVKDWHRKFFNKE
jgi:hypothetical protein